MGVGIKLGNRGKRLALGVCFIVGLTGLGALIPDLVDKPLWLLGLGDGKTHHEAFGHIGIGLTIAGAGVMVSLVFRLLWIRLLRR